MDLIEKIQSEYVATKFKPIFIITTGEESEEYLLRANELGIWDFLRKPIDFKELMDIIYKRLVERNN